MIKKGTTSSKKKAVKTPPKKESVPVAKKPVLKVHPIEAVLDNPLDIREVTSTPSEQEWSNSNGKVRNEYVGDTLTKRQELFCQLYATDTEFFGNGVQAYLEVYDIDREKPNWYKTACAATSQLLSNIKVCHRINDLLSEWGLNDQHVDKQLLFLITQHDDKGNKLWAIREYNKLKQRITDKIKDESESDVAKAEVYRTLQDKIKAMPKEEVSSVIQDLLAWK